MIDHTNQKSDKRGRISENQDERDTEEIKWNCFPPRVRIWDKNLGSTMQQKAEELASSKPPKKLDLTKGSPALQPVYCIQ